MFEDIHNEKKRRPVIMGDENLESWLYNRNSASDVQDLIDDDLWEGDLEAYPVTKDLYSRSVDSNYPGIIDKVDYEEVSISYG